MYDRKVGVIPFPHELVSTAGYKLKIIVRTKVDFQKTPFVLFGIAHRPWDWHWSRAVAFLSVVVVSSRRILTLFKP